jgi:hypothetical protein
MHLCEWVPLILLLGVSRFLCYVCLMSWCLSWVLWNWFFQGCSVWHAFLQLLGSQLESMGTDSVRTEVVTGSASPRRKQLRHPETASFMGNDALIFFLYKGCVPSLVSSCQTILKLILSGYHVHHASFSYPWTLFRVWEFPGVGSGWSHGLL